MGVGRDVAPLSPGESEGGGRRLFFRAGGASSEDPDHPARALAVASNSASSAGWRCARFCAYPQQLTVRLDRPGSRVRAVQVLSHEALIAKRVELWLGFVVHAEGEQQAAGAPARQAQGAGACTSGTDGQPEPVWRKMGHVSFADNASNDYGARELKSVKLDEANVSHVRLVLHRCHVNTRNIYNQVGIMALTVLGEPQGGMHAGSHGVGATPTPYELELELSMDPVTAQAVRELHAAKVAAVEREDYKDAKRLKAHIERLRHVGVRVAQLEARKRHAAACEDYDKCNELKAEIDVLRAHGLQAATGLRIAAQQQQQQQMEQLPEQQQQQQQQTEQLPEQTQQQQQQQTEQLPEQLQQQLHRQQLELQQQQQQLQQQGAALAAAQQQLAAQQQAAPAQQVASPAAVSTAAPTPRAPAPLAVPSPAGHAAPPSASATPTPATPAPPLMREMRASASNASGPGASKSAYQSYDDRPVEGGGKSLAEHMEVLDREEAARVARGEAPNIAASAKGAVEAEAVDGAANRSRSNTLESMKGGEPPEPEPLSAADAKDAQPLIRLFGERSITCAYSRTWSLREAALAKLEKDMPKAAEEDAPTACRHVLRLLERMLGDNNVAVFTAAQGVLKATFDNASSQDMEPAQLAAESENVCVALVKRAGDGNSRIKQQVADTALYLSGHELCGATVMENAICISKAGSSKAAKRGLTGRLELLQDLIPKFGVHDGDSGGAHLTLSLVMKFAVTAMDDSSNETRNRAIKVVLECYQFVGDAVRKYLKNLKPAIRDIVEVGLGQAVVGGVA